MQKGFTIIEFLIVVMIIGILAAIAIPQYQAYKNRASGLASGAPIKAEVLDRSRHHEKFRVKSPSGKCYEVFYTTEDIRLNSVTEVDCK